MQHGTKKFRYTPESIRDELTDRIGQGWTNDRIVAAYGDTGPNLRRWLNSRRAKMRREYGTERYG
jgi:hypothetical protein